MSEVLEKKAKELGVPVEMLVASSEEEVGVEEVITPVTPLDTGEEGVELGAPVENPEPAKAIVSGPVSMSSFAGAQGIETGVKEEDGVYEDEDKRIPRDDLPVEVLPAGPNDKGFMKRIRLVNRFMGLVSESQEGDASMSIKDFIDMAEFLATLTVPKIQDPGGVEGELIPHLDATHDERLDAIDDLTMNEYMAVLNYSVAGEADDEVPNEK